MSASLCRHCGKPPEADGDHTCTCPCPDDFCPDHPRPDDPWNTAERDGWLRREFERARQRWEQLPRWARPVSTRHPAPAPARPGVRPAGEADHG